MKFLNLLLVLLLPGVIYAADTTNLTRSAGKMVNDSSLELNSALASSPVVESTLVKPRGIENKSEPALNQQYRTANHGSLVEFEIFDAWVELTGDIDHDGFFHRIKTTFDADVNTSVETVYAKLYLSYEGGPWQQYADSDMFEIYYDSIDDTYEVVGELIEGYPPGYYEVLIELHSFYHEGVVASRMISSDADGYAISLEDLSYDEIYIQETYYYEPDYIVGAGSFSWVGILMLGLLLIIKLKYFPTTKLQKTK